MTSCKRSFLNGMKTWPTLIPSQLVSIVVKSSSTCLKHTIKGTGSPPADSRQNSGGNQEEKLSEAPRSLHFMYPEEGLKPSIFPVYWEAKNPFSGFCHSKDLFFEKYSSKRIHPFFQNFPSFKSCFDFYVTNFPKSLIRQYCIKCSSNFTHGKDAAHRSDLTVGISILGTAQVMLQLLLHRKR